MEQIFQDPSNKAAKVYMLYTLCIQDFTFFISFRFTAKRPDWNTCMILLPVGNGE